MEMRFTQLKRDELMQQINNPMDSRPLFTQAHLIPPSITGEQFATISHVAKLATDSQFESSSLKSEQAPKSEQKPATSSKGQRRSALHRDLLPRLQCSNKVSHGAKRKIPDPASLNTGGETAGSAPAPSKAPKRIRQATLTCSEQRLIELADSLGLTKGILMNFFNAQSRACLVNMSTKNEWTREDLAEAFGYSGVQDKWDAAFESCIRRINNGFSNIAIANRHAGRNDPMYRIHYSNETTSYRLVEIELPLPVQHTAPQPGTVIAQTGPGTE
jgi:hypothetical protein